jgi:hypothetical protein
LSHISLPNFAFEQQNNHNGKLGVSELQSLSMWPVAVQILQDLQGAFSSNHTNQGGV